jgi:hypothetical protein
MRSRMTVTPVTIKQLLTCAKLENPGDANFKLDGKELVNVRLVARIVAIEDDASKSRLTLADGTYTPITVDAYNEGTAFWSQRRETWCVRGGGGGRAGAGWGQGGGVRRLRGWEAPPLCAPPSARPTRPPPHPPRCLPPSPVPPSPAGLTSCAS